MNRVAKKLGIKYPFIQGPMSWLTNAEFAAAVSNAGGLGILGPNAGQTEVTPDPVETAERMRREIQKVRTLTDKPFAVTLIGGNGGPTSDFTMKTLAVVIEEKVPAVLVNSVGALTGGGYGIEPALLAPLKEHHIKIIVRAWQPSIADAQAVEKQGGDVYVATGFDEGGTLPGAALGSFSVVPMIVDSVDIPICLAGGISDARTVNAAFALGAEGVFVGSRLIPTVENPAAESVKQLIVNSTAEDLKLFRVAPAYYRSLPTTLRNQLVENDQEKPAKEVLADNAKLMGGTSGMRIGMLEGDLEHGYVSVGTGISVIHKIQPVEEVVNEMMVDYKIDN
ncbi:enoyl-ACP reductase 2 [Secundilactobacillus pentosiphilus]|uniref:Probable nitronate monooxygenase n=1 Tax=Secundilactobacillus pentosiphilus TaxID=1714682 RepID=A0A1Z5INB2_9LACO|nr:nitronate monooxygenase [Secundilactobacillus pentosiphilus]GAX02921.1 enoyl-ACP reductase 2 [Secundilactobacillus pentosiphilus]